MFFVLHQSENITVLLYDGVRKNKKIIDAIFFLVKANVKLKHLVNWLNANKISLNVTKTEIFKSKQKKFAGDLKIKLCGKRLHPTESVKYLGVKIDANPTWQHHVNDRSIIMNSPKALLFKMRKYVSLKMLRSICFAIFYSYSSYCCVV